MPVVSCLDILTHVQTMTDVPGDIRECCDTPGVLGPCKGILQSAALYSSV